VKSARRSGLALLTKNRVFTQAGPKADIVLPLIIFLRLKSVNLAGKTRPRSYDQGNCGMQFSKPPGDAVLSHRGSRRDL